MTYNCLAKEIIIFLVISSENPGCYIQVPLYCVAKGQAMTYLTNTATLVIQEIRYLNEFLYEYLVFFY